MQLNAFHVPPNSVCSSNGSASMTSSNAHARCRVACAEGQSTLSPSLRFLSLSLSSDVPGEASDVVAAVRQSQRRDLQGREYARGPEGHFARAACESGLIRRWPQRQRRPAAQYPASHLLSSVPLTYTGCPRKGAKKIP